jgi:hypothetical protein
MMGRPQKRDEPEDLLAAEPSLSGIKALESLWLSKLFN